MSAATMSPETIVQMLMKGVAPERVDEIDALWEAYHPKVRVVEDKKGITLEACKDFIDFDPKTIDVFWLLGFSAWKAIECYSPHVVVSADCGTSLQVLIADDDELPAIERTYKERLSVARSLIAERDASVVQWPHDVPLPTSDRGALADEQHKAAFDLTCLATGFAFFHEFRHVMLDFDQQRPKDRREEELQCDVWAREFMTAKLEGYARDNSHSYHEVLRKRSMGLAIAALILHEITPTHGYNPHYFSIKTRLSALLHNTPLPAEDPFWRFAASLLVGVFRQQHIAFNPQPMSARALAEFLLAELPD